MLRKYGVIIFFFLESYTSIFAKNIHPDNHKSFDAHAGLKEVDISYDHDFPYRDDYDNQKIMKCEKNYRTMNANYVEGIRHTAIKKSIPVLRCREHIRLLRSSDVINQWLYIQSKKHVFPLTIKEFNIINVPAHITAVHTTITETFYPASYSDKIKKVTGVFERHAMNIKKYTLKNTKTEKIITIHSTPDHLVYVKNKAAFIPMNLLSSTDELLNNAGQRIKLICSTRHTGHCGVSLNNTAPTLIYNLEIDKNHTYFVSKLKLLVHNECQLTEDLYSEIPELLRHYGKTDSSIRRLMINSHDDIRKAYRALRKIRGDVIQSDTLAILTMALHHHEPIPIQDLESFLYFKSVDDMEDGYDFMLTSLLQAEKNDQRKDINTLKRILSTPEEDRIFVVFTDKQTAVVIHSNKSENSTARILPSDQNQQPFELNKSSHDIYEGVFHQKEYGDPVRYFTILPENRVLRWGKPIF